MKLPIFLALLIGLQAFFHPLLSAVGLRPYHKNGRKAKIANVSPAAAPAVTIISQDPGPTPFISQIHVNVNPADALRSVRFTITPKAGSVTRPVSAIYTSNYLQSRAYLNTTTGDAFIPMFGLYANYSNTAVLNFFFSDGSSQQNSLPVATADWTDSCGIYKTPTVLQARTASTSLNYDYMLIKNPCGSQSPVILDTDGAVRWVGPTGFNTFASMFFANGIYISSPPPSSSVHTGISRIDFDGIVTFVHDYSNIGVAESGHHNYDPGRDGMLLEVTTNTQTESVLLEIDSSGNVLHTWNFADIISAAITAGGGDPSQFVANGNGVQFDWFHMNAATYHKPDNTLIVSSRENFVIAVDYDTHAIKWILGDETKQWYQFQGLRQYAVTVDPNSLPPIGQHAISISSDDNLLLFDDGRSSQHHTPAGADRTYSAPRKYHIDTQAMTATEVWNYENGQSLYSPFCSSIYEDAPFNYLVDYAIISNLGAQQLAELLGLDSAGNKIFDYRFNTSGCNTMWNAIPIHLDGITFTSVVPVSAVSRKTHGGAGTYDINLPLVGAPGIECRSGAGIGNYQVVVTFTGPITVSSANVTPGLGGSGSVSGTPTVNGNQVTVNLTGVSNAQTLALNLLGVSDGTNTDNISVPMSTLSGDTNGDRFVDSADISQTKSQSGNPVNASNFREDLNVDGFHDSADISFVRSKTGTALP